MQMVGEGRGPIKAASGQELASHSPFDIPWINRSLSSSMVKYFSVDWLAQSHEHTAVTEDAAPACRPHIPCMVQPCPPTFGKSYLQPKPRATKPVESVESSGQDANLCSPFHPTSWTSPSKFTTHGSLHFFDLKEKYVKLCALEWCITSCSFLQFQKPAGIPPGMRARRLPLSVSLWMMAAMRRKTQRSAECAPNSPPSRSTNWRKSSTSTNTLMLERG